jgi:hypothetical protein
MSHRDSPIKKNKELKKPMDIFNVGFVGAAGTSSGSALDYDTDFSSGTGDWTASRNYAGFSNNKMYFSIVTDGTNTSISYDLGGTASDTWTLKFMLELGTQSRNGLGYAHGLSIGLSDKDYSTADSSSQDFIGLRYMHDNIPRTLAGAWANNQNLYTNYCGASDGTYGCRFGGNVSSGTVYIKVQRLSNTTYRIRNYGTDSTYTTSVSDTGTVTMSSEPTDLQYIVLRNLRSSQNQSGGNTLNMDNLEFEDGVLT